MRSSEFHEDGACLLLNKTRGTVLASRVTAAVTRRARLRGLIGRPGMQPGEALVIPGCRQVHTFGMRIDIDVLFLDRSWKVLAALPGLAPGRLSRFYTLACAVVELPEGTIAATGTAGGDIVLPGPREHVVTRPGSPGPRDARCG